MEGKKTPSSRRKSKDTNSAIKQAEDSFYNLKYKYSSFDEMKEPGEVNFYGIIYDASFPKEEDNLPYFQEQKSLYQNILVF